MEHHHEPTGLDEATLAMKKYWLMPRIYEFDTEIKEIEENKIRLQENYFYPEGGGQPADKGILVSGDKKLNVVDVQEEGNTVWLITDDNSFQEGFSVHAKIDQNRRENLTRNHSAQHLLSAVFWDEYEYETERALIEISDTEVELDQSPSIEEIDNAIKLADKFIESELEIESLFYEEEELQSLNIRGGIIDDYNIYRLVKIGTIDLNPCGGTHVQNTGLIDTIAVRKVDGKRIKFVTGREARNFYIENLQTVHSISKNLGIPFQKVPDEVNRLNQTNQVLQKELQDLENQFLSNQLQHPKQMNIGDFILSHISVTNLNRGVILDHVGDLTSNDIVVVTKSSGEFVLTSGSEELTDELITNLRKQGVRGGGRGTTVMGTSESEERMIELVSSYLQSRS